MIYENPDKVKIGLEIHVQLNKANTKMFCGCTTDYTESGPNECVCPGCLALPGVPPVLNQSSIDFAIRIGLALNAKINKETDFYLKNYFYPDLGSGYQTTQFDKPIVYDGYVLIDGEDGLEHKVRIRRAHMEDDPAKLVHFGTIDKSTGSAADFNRSGMPLVEIVTEPDMRSPKEVRRFLDKLRSILEYLDVVDSTREGSIKADVNVSVQNKTRVEVKNISSHRAAEKAAQFEIMRQKDAYRKGKEVVQETRHFDEVRNVTVSLRAKETEDDYRYFPAFDLVSYKITDKKIQKIKDRLPELPDAKRERFVKQYDLSEALAKSLTTEKEFADFFENAARKTDPKMAASWADIIRGELNYRDLSVKAIKTEELIRIVELVSENKINDVGGVLIVRTLLDEGGTADQIVKAKNLGIAEDDETKKAAVEAVSENPEAVSDYLNGTEKAINFIVGKVMQKTKGKADAKTAREMVIEAIDEKYNGN
ncbi:MAG: Asp-tRNA(Asn)/Glu-tRNA(Gln) amidotransferase subunit GatB [Methanosarcinaceae archaeon]|nr:Asp-tRNA(Asn)/Glu-tRNA(Gln) amidotransferase subunit GatB [Methanosarcinaceae archaeon]